MASPGVRAGRQTLVVPVVPSGGGSGGGGGLSTATSSGLAPSPSSGAVL